MSALSLRHCQNRVSALIDVLNSGFGGFKAVSSGSYGTTLECMDGYIFTATGTGFLSYAISNKVNIRPNRLSAIENAYAANYQRNVDGSFLWTKMQVAKDMENILAAGVRKVEVPQYDADFVERLALGSSGSSFERHHSNYGNNNRRSSV